MLEPQETFSETTASVDLDSALPFDPDATWPYILEPEEDDVYRVGWTADVEHERESESEEEVIERRELLTHVFHPDREPAPYTEIDDEQNVEIDNEQNVAQITPHVHVKDSDEIPRIIKDGVNCTKKTAAFGIGATGQFWVQYGLHGVNERTAVTLNIESSASLRNRYLVLRKRVSKHRSTANKTIYHLNIFEGEYEESMKEV